jgi:hypothetical protein
MINLQTIISRVLDPRSTAPEKNGQNVLLWESLVIRMISLPNAA